MARLRLARMDDARKLLDSLMGQSRDASFEEAKKNKGENFKKDNVCKPFLLGFCPCSELAESKMAGKRNISDCKKVHSDAMRDEFNRHPEKERIKVEYEKSLLPVLEGLVREADAWVSRERANVSKISIDPEQVTANNMPPSVLEQYEQLKKDMNKMIAAAEAEAEKGNVDGSKFKVMLADEIKDKVKELDDKYIATYTVTHRGEEVCDICGTRYEALTSTNQARHNAHFKGKVHLSYAKIREWITDLRKKNREEDRGRPREDRDGRDRGRDDRGKDKDRGRGDEAGDADGGKRRSRSRSRRERRRSRSRRDRRDRSRDRRDRRDRSRSRERRR